MKTQFLKDWNENQFKTVKKAAVKYLRSRYFETMHGGEDRTPFAGMTTFKQFDSVLGTAYTSTGICAGLWVCNTELYLDNAREWHLVGFVMDKNSFVHAWFEDAIENNLIFPIN